MPKKIKPIRILVCIHESGHAIAAVALGVGIERVTVHLNHPLMRGVCWIAPETPCLDENHTVIDAAGEAAVELYRPGGGNEIDRHLGPGSLERAKAAFNDIGLEFSPERDLPKSDGDHIGASVALQSHKTPEDRNQYFVTLCLRAIDLLSPLWEAVLWVADELYQFGEVSGSRVREIVAACSKPRRV